MHCTELQDEQWSVTLTYNSARRLVVVGQRLQVQTVAHISVVQSTINILLVSKPVTNISHLH